MITHPKAVVSVCAMALTLSAAEANIAVDATSGFTGWTEQLTSGNGSENGSFIGASGTGMDTGGSSWGLYANTGQTSAQVYDFGSVLQVGDTVSLSVSIGFIDAGGTVGFGLQNSSGDNRFESYYIGGSTDAFKLNDSGGQEDITGVSTSFGDATWNDGTPSFLTFTFTQEAADAYSLEVGGVSVTNAGLNLTASDISQIRIFNFNAGSGGTNNQYFNSLVSSVPEPSAFALIGGLFALGFVCLRRR